MLIEERTLKLNYLPRRDNNDDDDNWCFTATFVHVVG